MDDRASPGGSTIDAAGTATTTASQEGITSPGATLTVTPIPASDSITVSPGGAAIEQDRTRQFTAMGTFDDGSRAELTTGVT